MPRCLHIVSFDVPYPPNYGGVIDVYYKLAWLKEAGVKIYLHCFYYGRKKSLELEALCEKVFYYERKTGFLSNLSFLPYTVRSRRSKLLEQNLLADGHPILFEVLHTCYLLSDSRFAKRKKIYRHSNIEHNYYMELSRSERNFFKKIYLRIESFKLRHFEPMLRFADLILAVNQEDNAYFNVKYPQVRSLYLPSFHPNKRVNIQEGMGGYILFHGNLGVSENYKAAEWLLREVFSGIGVPCVLAGLNPPAFLERMAGDYPNVKLIAAPGQDQMEELIRNAHVHILYTDQPTGLKLKLLNVLFNGRFVLSNPAMLSGTGIRGDESLFVCDAPGDFISQATKLMTTVFSRDMLEARKNKMAGFNNDVNGKALLDAVFPGQASD